MLYVDLNRKIESSSFAAAIEMTPNYHALLCLELGVAIVSLTTYKDLPIIFVANGAVRVINNDQYKLRRKYNEILRIYKGKYNEYKNCINNAYKIVNVAFMVDMVVLELKRLSLRLLNLDDQISQLDKLYKNL